MLTSYCYYSSSNTDAVMLYRYFSRWWFCSMYLLTLRSPRAYLCQELSWAGESWAARYQNSWLKQEAKMKVMVKLFMWYTIISWWYKQEIKLRKGPTPPCSIFPQGLAYWLRVKWISRDVGVIIVFSLLKGPWRKASCLFMNLRLREEQRRRVQCGKVLSIESECRRVFQGFLPPPASRFWQRLWGRYLGKAPHKESFEERCLG